MKIKNIKLFLLFLFPVVCTACVDNNAVMGKKSGSEQILKDFVAFESEKGVKQWTLKSAEAVINDSQKNVQLKAFTVDFYDKDGITIKSVLKADAGRMDTSKNDFYTKGRTTMKSTVDGLLESTDLYYKAQTKLIYGDSYVKLTRKDSVIEGSGFEATPDFSSVIIKENTVDVKESK
ncbi:MAG: LPS export ABC transporter periplasmic protein LptC [Elusimicrobia bacterium RIFOXYA2_FULL_39_19]|nr:MAG: LPS export ABC transporter periplasmic protein LptC [Elusimicrobia bacterium RIFOXYA2_FULL_39_19]